MTGEYLRCAVLHLFEVKFGDAIVLSAARCHPGGGLRRAGRLSADNADFDSMNC